MKKIILISAYLLFPFLIFSQSGEIKQNQLTTIGNATLYFKADRAQLNFRVKGEGPTIEEAVKQSTDRLKTIVEKLKPIGILEDQLQTSFFNSVDNPSGKSWWNSSKDFLTLFEVTITFDDFKIIEKTIDLLSQEQVDLLSKLKFSLNKDSTKIKAVYKLAASDAKNKADAVAQTLGAIISRVLYVEDQSPGNYDVEVKAQAPPEYIFSGKHFPISSRLRVIFELGYKN